ncbi:MAG: hypothetical protein AB3N20_10800 [Rhizobiaceae bacterium]
MTEARVFHRTNLEGEEASDGKRPVILHFHTFKNAGSSVDAVLQQCFPDAWANFDGPVPEFFIHHSELEIIARNRSQLKAISSHQIRLPVPQSQKVEFLPIVFIRRPELRIASIWRFQRQRHDNHPATLLAKQLSFREWVVHNLAKKLPQATDNGQTHLFSYDLDKRRRVREPGALERAIRNLEELPLVGIVEKFDQSMKLFEALYQPKIPEFQYQSVGARNATGDVNLSEDKQLEQLREDLGCDLFKELQAANAVDIELYNHVTEKYRLVAGNLNVTS